MKKLELFFENYPNLTLIASNNKLGCFLAYDKKDQNRMHYVYDVSEGQMDFDLLSHVASSVSAAFVKLINENNVVTETIDNDDYFEAYVEVTEVIFRKYKKSLGGGILALFPYEMSTQKGDISCYEHIGQHGSADYNHCIAITTPATIEEAQALKTELESIGYSLKVIQKKVHAKYLKAYYEMKNKS